MNILLRSSNNITKFNCFKLSISSKRSYSDLPIFATQNVNDGDYDSVILIGNDFEKNLSKYKILDDFKSLQPFKDKDENFEKNLTFTVCNDKRVFYSPTGPLNRGHDDVRSIADATAAALKKAIKTGSKKPLIVNCLKDNFKYSDKVALLSALSASHIPLEVREHKNNTQVLKIDKLGLWHNDLNEANKIINVVNGIELGRIVGRDIGGSDPERMTPIKVQEYVENNLQSEFIKMEIIDSKEDFEKSYPCFAAVNRAADIVPRHRGRIIKLEYTPPGSDSGTLAVDKTLFLIGKGITYDTGGADIKHGGNMTSMHRDKCGAAFVAGFFKTLSILKPKCLKVYGTLCLTRNNVGEGFRFFDFFKIIILMDISFLLIYYRMLCH
jgi:leucyl aminopeptidase